MFLITIFFALGIITPPGVAFEPTRSWYTLESEHFLVHFSSRGKITRERIDFARDVAAIAEEVRNTVRAATGAAPRGRIHLIVADFFEEYNGWAVPFPVNTITIVPVPPDEFKGNDDDWLRTLILHEFSHILQLEARRGAMEFLGRIFGQVILPNALLPTWLVEGYAVYNESRFSSFGRLRSAEWRGVLQTAAQDNRLLPIDRCDGYELQRYPRGLTPYLYGGKFLEFIAAKYPDEFIEEFNRHHSGQVPFCENRTARNFLGKDFPTLWREWQGRLIDETEARCKALGPVTRIRSLSGGECYVTAPCWAKDGRGIYYVADEGGGAMAIKFLELGTLTQRVVYRGNLRGGIALSPDGRRLAFVRALVNGSGEEFSDIFLLDLETRKTGRLTFNERARDPDFSPDGSSLVYVSNWGSQSRLMILNLKTGDKRPIGEDNDRIVYHHPHFSPGGRLVAVEVWRPGGYVDVEVIDIATGWIIPITSDRACDIFPAWSGDGNFLLFVSDRDGIFNLYAYDVEKQGLYCCTNVTGGVFAPAVSPDGRNVALVLLSSEGHRLGLTGLVRRNWKPAGDFVDTFPKNEYPATAVHPQIYYYYPLGSLFPQFWLPWMKFKPGVELGAFTMGWDVLQFHRYWLLGGYRWAEPREPFLRFRYELLRYFLGVELDADLSWRAQRGRLGVKKEIYGNDWFQHAGCGFTFERDRGRLGRKFDAFWGFSNARLFRFNVAPGAGRVLGFLGGAESGRSPSGGNVYKIAGYWDEYLGARPPATWSLKFRLALGKAFGDSAGVKAFQLSNDFGLFAVRGYQDRSPSGAAVGIAGLEFRMPICWVERGVGTAPVFLRDLNGAVFCDVGAVQDADGRGPGDLRCGVGAELRVDLTLARYVPFNVTLGAAAGIGPELSRQVYFTVSSELLSSIFEKRQTYFVMPRRSGI